MKDIPISEVEAYQCPGCAHGPDPATCPKYRTDSTYASGCVNHVPGTMIMPGIGVIALGLPKGFCRYGQAKTTPILVHESYAALIQRHPNMTSIFSVPVWCYLDDRGNTISRWFSPRTNFGWSEVFLGDCTKDLTARGCRQLTDAEVDGMD